MSSFFRRSYELVKGAVRRGMPSNRFAREGEDTAQDVRLAVLKNLPHLRIQTRGGFLSWLKEVVRSVLSRRERELRAARRYPPAPLVSLDQEGAPVAVSGERSPEAVAEEREELRIVRETIETLPQRHREILRIINQSSPSPRELAAALGVTEAAARMRAQRAIVRLQRALRKRGYGYSLKRT
jgi:RNA polymerase sigma-70 factor (ECF subfamily)